MTVGKNDALKSLRPGAEWVWSGADKQWSNLKWVDTKQTQPTEAEVNAEVTRLTNLETANAYQGKRRDEYSYFGDQLDQLWHDIDDGKLDKTGSWYLAIKAVKDKYPKS